MYLQGNACPQVSWIQKDRITTHIACQGYNCPKNATWNAKVQCSSRRGYGYARIIAIDIDTKGGQSSRNETLFQKRADSLWKVGALVSSAGGIENAVTNAVKIGSVMLLMHTGGWTCHQTFDPLATFIRANSFTLFVKRPFELTSPSLTPNSISEFKKRMEQYGYANNMVLAFSNYRIHFGNPERFVSTTICTLAW